MEEKATFRCSEARYLSAAFRFRSKYLPSSWTGTSAANMNPKRQQLVARHRSGADARTLTTTRTHAWLSLGLGTPPLPCLANDLTHFSDIISVHQRLLHLAEPFGSSGVCTGG